MLLDGMDFESRSTREIVVLSDPEPAMADEPGVEGSAVRLLLRIGDFIGGNRHETSVPGESCSILFPSNSH